MNDHGGEESARLRDAAEAIGRLARNPEAFGRAFKAWQKRDPGAWRSVLTELRLWDRCALICDWFCNRYCIYLCVKLCGRPVLVEPGPEELREFAQATARITANEDVLHNFIDVIEREDTRAFKALIAEHKLERFCHYFCHWICFIRCRLVCRLLCGRRPDFDFEGQLLSELRDTGEAVGKLADKKGALQESFEVFRAADSDRYRAVLSRFELLEHCILLCRWFCGWHCLPICFVFCPEPPVRERFTVDVVRESALATARLAASPDDLRLLSDAVRLEDIELFRELIARFQLERLCHFVCHWICYFWCGIVCEWLCPPPLICKITGPLGCTEEEINENIGALTVTVTGTAGGDAFDHYTLEWRKVEGGRCDDDQPWNNLGVHYPGGASSGTSPVFGGILGWLDTTSWAASSYEVRLCVFGRRQRSCCCIQFNLFKRLVWIDSVDGASVQTPPGPFDSNAPIVGGGVLVPVGGCVTVRGTAFVGECENRKIACMDLRHGLGFLPGPSDPGFSPASFTSSLLPEPLCYTDADPLVESKKRAPWNQLFFRELTTRWVKNKVKIFGFEYEFWKLSPFCFASNSLLPLGVSDPGGCPDPGHRCRSGKYTLLLEVTDTGGNTHYDTQHVWFDNKPISAEFAGIDGLKSCDDLHLASFTPPNAPCSVQWWVDLMGVAYDEYIDETDITYPSDNFDYYSLRITKQGGPTMSIPIHLPGSGFSSPDAFRGTSRVGEPGMRCEPMPTLPGCPPPPPVPAHAIGLLSQLDLRVFDELCSSSLSSPYSVPSGFALKRASPPDQPGECCGYAFRLYAQDKTWSDGWAGGYHRALTEPWAVCVCNDLPPIAD